MNQESRVVLITGGNRGIGLAMSRAFQQEGYQVFITSRSGEPVPGCIVIQADLNEADRAAQVIDQVENMAGRIDVLVANAGISKEILLVRYSDEEILDVINTNLVANIKLARRTAKSMLKARSGSIIFMGSVLGMTGAPGSTVYAASKAALIGLSRSLAREIGSRGITVNVLAPGYVQTEMTDSLPEVFKDKVIADTALGRIATPSDIAGVAVFLASAEARFITGAVIPVDGGLGMGH